MKKDKMHRRKHYFIDRDFQLGFIIKFCALIVTTSVLTGLLIYYFNRQTTTVAFENLRVVVKSTSDFILPMMLQILVVVTILVGAGTIITALFTSHKIAGPVYRLRAELEKIKGGDFSSAINVRPKDQLKKVVSEFNDMRLQLKDSIGLLKGSWASVKTTLVKLQPQIKDAEEKKRLQEYIDKMDSELGKFKIE